MFFSVSGLRGIVGEDLNFFSIYNYINVFCEYIKGENILIGCDTRPSSLPLSLAISGFLTWKGKKVFDAGVIPTPTFVYNTKFFDGGIIITASHNPSEYNALKFASKGRLFSFKDFESFKELLSKSKNEFSFVYGGEYNKYYEALNKHIEAILQSPFVKVDAIRKNNFRVIVDCINGAGYKAIPILLEALHCKVECLNCEPTGKFVHNPEPTKDSLKELDRRVRSGDYDIGFAVDPDADRLVVALPDEGVLSEEYTLPLFADYILNFEKSGIVCNLSTSRMVEDVSEYYGVDVFRTKVGESNVVDSMINLGYTIGGEGNGGVIFSKINLSRDSLLGIAFILSKMALGFKIIPDYIYGKYKMFKDKVNFSGRIDYKEIENFFYAKGLRPLKVCYEDGIRADFEYFWVHIRKSNTEPVVRIIGETEIDFENKFREIFGELKREIERWA